MKNILKALFTLLIILMLTQNKSIAQNKYVKICLQGIEMEKNGNLEGAIAKYGEAITLNPSDWSGYYYRANVLFHKQKYTEELTDLNQAIHYAPTKMLIYKTRAYCYFITEDYKNAIADYNILISKNDNRDKSLFNMFYYRGRALYITKQYNDAISDFNSSIKLAKEQKYSCVSDIYNWRASCYYEIAKYNEAIADYKVYLQDNKNDVNALFFLGRSYIKNGDETQAKITAQLIKELAPSENIYFKSEKSIELYNLEARQKNAKSLYDEASKLITELNQIPSKSLQNIQLISIFQLLDSSWYYSCRYTSDESALRDSILSKLLFVYPKLKDKPELKEDARKFMVQATKGTEEKKYAEAIALWGKSLSITPYYPLAYYNRALLFDLQGNFSQAIKDMKTYVSLSPNAPDVRSAKDKIYEWELKEKNGSNNQAIGVINKIVTNNYNPGNFVFSLAFGGSFGPEIAPNTMLKQYWAANITTKADYTDTPHLLLSGDAEAVIKPIKWVGFGMFVKTLGGIGSAYDQSTRYHLNMKCNQIGGLARVYLLNNDNAAKLDVYLQYSFGTNKLSGYYGIAGSNSIYTDMTDFTATTPYHCYSIGMGGKIGKHGYIVMSGDYIYSNFKTINYVVTQVASTATPNGASGILTLNGEQVNAQYNGFVIKFLFGFCF